MTDDEIDAITNAQWGGSARLLHAAYRAYARAIESAATAPLLERIAELEAKLAQQAEHVPEVHFGKTMKPETLRIELQKKCSAWGAYWRGSDAHGVELTTDQAVELLENALNVEVEINDEEAEQEANLNEPVGWVAPRPDVVDWRSYEPEVGTPLFTRPQPEQEPMPERKKEEIASNYFAADWAISKAMDVIGEVERYHGIRWKP